MMSNHVRDDQTVEDQCTCFLVGYGQGFMKACEHMSAGSRGYGDKGS